MKEDKIIELLKKCANYTDCMLKCPCCGGLGRKAVKLDQEALQLILRLQTENELFNEKIERLKVELENSKAVATKLEKEVEEQDAEIERLKADIEARDGSILWLTKELDHQKAIASAELDSLHKLGDDYAKVLEEEQQHIREAKVEAVKEIGHRIIDGCHKGVIGAVNVIEIVFGYMKECETDER